MKSDVKAYRLLVPREMAPGETIAIGTDKEGREVMFIYGDGGQLLETLLVKTTYIPIVEKKVTT